MWLTSWAMSLLRLVSGINGLKISWRAMYQARSLEYERTVLAGLVDDDPVPPQEPPRPQIDGGDCASVIEAVAQRAV